MRINRAFLTLICAGACIAAAAAAGYDRLAERASRSFQWEEWSSAAAMYELMLKERPDSLSSYARAITANQMVGDSAATVELVERAMSHGIGLSAVLEAVRLTDFSIGQGDRYGTYLHHLRNSIPWMSRALDNELLGYYTFRNDGPMMVKYANIMLAGLPDSVEYLALIANGQLLAGQPAEAAATWKKILEIDPDNFPTLVLLGNYYLQQGNETEGKTLLSKAQSVKQTPYITTLLQP